MPSDTPQDAARAAGATRPPGVGGRAAPGAALVWGAAVGAYSVAVLHRSSLAVSAVEAVDRFHIGAAVLSSFVVVQLAVYAAMQIPGGVLLDRLGPRRLIGTGAAVMAVGQVLLGTVDTLPLAYLARVLIGAGDAVTFISAIRLVPAWFPARRVPMFTQLTGMAGLLGQLAAAIPLVAVLHHTGWSATFVGMGAVGVLASALAWAGIRDRPAGTSPHVSSSSVGQHLRAALRTPGTWLGFFSHAVGYFPTAVFMLLWGFPFLTEAQGLTPGTAGAVLSVNTIAAVAAGPVVGSLTGRHPLRRSWMVVAFAACGAAAWAAVLLQPGPSPLWLLVVLVAVLGIGGPVSSIAFDFVRTSNPVARLGTAMGVANTGGFLFAVVTVQGIGLVLDAVGGDTPLSLAAFRVAFAVQAVPWGIAIAGALVARRSARRVLATQGVVVAPVREVLARRRQERSEGRGGA